MRSAREQRVSRAIDEDGVASCQPTVQARHHTKLPGFWRVSRMLPLSCPLRVACLVDAPDQPTTGSAVSEKWSSACSFLSQTREAFMAEPLLNKRIAALVDDGFEESELLEPKRALEAAGAKVDIVSSQVFRVTGWQDGDWSQGVNVEYHVESANP